MLAVLGSGAARSGSTVTGGSCAPPSLGMGTGEGANDPNLFPPWKGKLRAAMLFVQFPDAKGVASPQSVFDSYIPPVEKWYSTASYGRLSLEVTPLPRWIMLPRPASYYGDSHVEQVLPDAVHEADPTFDFSPYAAVYIVPARDAALGPLGVGILQQSLTVDGGSIRAVVWLTTDGDPANNVPYAVHETGHLLGLPDLYGGQGRGSFHWWDTMATGGTAPVTGGLFAWHRWKLDWLDPNQVACLSARGTRVTTVSPVEQAGGTKALIVRRGSHAYVAEVRQRKAEDSGICRPGVLLYAIDLSRPPKRGAIRVLAPRLDDSSRWAHCGSHWNATMTVGNHLQVGHIEFRVLAEFPDRSYRIRARVR